MAVRDETDLYAELGVEPSATIGEIGAAFRARAKELHPDARPGDADAAERFKRVTTAYRVLSNTVERTQTVPELWRDIAKSVACNVFIRRHNHTVVERTNHVSSFHSHAFGVAIAEHNVPLAGGVTQRAVGGSVPGTERKTDSDRLGK